MTSQRQHRELKRRGPAARPAAAAVEMALVLPLVLLLTFAAVDFGRVVHANLAVSNATRCGAEYGSMHEFTAINRASWEAKIRAAMEDEMASLSGFLTGNLQTTYTTTNDSDGLFQVTVTASYPFATIVAWPGIPSQVVLYHQVQMRQIR